MFDSVDIFTSRRNMFNECLFWHRFDDEDLSSMINISPEYGELIYDRSPDGTFWANEFTPFSHDTRYLSNAFATDENSVTLETNDNVSVLSQNDMVFFDNQLWLVVSIQRTKRKRQSQYSKDNLYKTIIVLRR